ncbi:peptidoglycan -binding protein [Amaricoccus solimangrovi]|uniref:Peptidoglycan-binding protein n=1 Tax=Amaricoccus solimangrovi TaxID=2589815 RepID=A0A501WWL4_9RHOB|nr:peptidoglycan -binding protein [Amaricoccus solimangrovi]TPE53858.1 peptidoglycan -binding protein [Amaricoccus solimangrovi]
MALRVRANKFHGTIWPGFVDAMGALLMILFFVLSIFMIVQYVLKDTITGQKNDIESLSAQVASLGDALGLERSRADTQTALVATLRAQREAAQARIAELMSSNTDLGQQLTAAEQARDARSAEVAGLRDELAGNSAALTAMNMKLEEERRKAEETLTLLAAAEAARDKLSAEQATTLDDARRKAAELAQARALLADQKDVSAEGQRQIALLNQQTAQLRDQLAALQGLLDQARAEDAANQVQVETLGANLNAALAKVASEQAARAALEEKERRRLEAEAKDLEHYRSEFFGRMRDILGSQEGVEVVGDRFVFPSEVLFAPGSATLNAEGQAQVARVAGVIRGIMNDIPSGIDWILRVDGHTDRTPVGPGSPYRDNWELSQERALSVVRYMIEAEGIPANRLAATGFGEFQPIDTGDGPEALARNRRIELKFTER